MEKPGDGVYNRNMIILPQNGKVMMTTDHGENDPLPLEEILNTYFHKLGVEEVESMELNYEELMNADTYDLLPYHPKIKMFYSVDMDKPWQYNELMSVYVGKPICSDPVVFIDEEELEGKSNCPFEVFNVLVGTFKQMMDGIIAKFKEEQLKKNEEPKETADFPDRPTVLFNQDTQPKETETKAKNDTVIKKRPNMQERNFSRDFNLSCIKYILASGVEYEIPATKENHWQERDVHWIQHFAGKFDQRFFIRTCTPSDELEIPNRWFVLDKPHLFAFMDSVLGEVNAYFTGYTKEWFDGLSKELIPTISMNETDRKAKQKEIYSKYYS